MSSTCRRGHNGDRLRAHRSTGLSVNAPACRPGCRGGQMRIAVMGAGGVGGFYGAKLAEAGHDVVLIARGRHLEAIREHGLSIENLSDGRVSRSAVAVTDDPASIGRADLILFAVKQIGRAHV